MKKYLLLITLFSSLIFNAQILLENFETLGVNDLPMGWSETGLSTDGIYSIGRSSDINGPEIVFPEHTKFIYTNDDTCDCNKSEDRLILPSLDLSSYTEVTLRFAYFFTDEVVGTANLEVSTDGGTTWTNLLALPNRNAWADNQIVNLDSYAGNSSVMLSFIYNDLGFYGAGLALDDIRVFNTLTGDVLSNTNKQLESFTIYPNPVNNVINFNTNIEFTSLEIININGQKLMEYSKNPITNSIDVSQLNKGIYFLNIVNGKTSVTKKFIKL